MKKHFLFHLIEIETTGTCFESAASHTAKVFIWVFQLARWCLSLMFHGTVRNKQSPMALLAEVLYAY